MKFHDEWILGSLSLVGEVIERPGHEAEHHLPISSEVKYEWSCTSSPPVYLHGMYRDDYHVSGWMYCFLDVLNCLMFT
jgi:hypothetical protein